MKQPTIFVLILILLLTLMVLESDTIQSRQFHGRSSAQK